MGDLELLGDRRRILAQLARSRASYHRVAERLGVDERRTRRRRRVDQQLAEPRYRHRRVEMGGETTAFSNVTCSPERPSRQSGGHAHEPGGAPSSTSSVTGSVIGTIPVSSSTVAVLIVFEPDMPSYEQDSHDQEPSSASGVRGEDQIELQLRRPSASNSSSSRARRPRPRATASSRASSSQDVEHAADDDPARLPLGVGIDAEDPAWAIARKPDVRPCRAAAAGFPQRARSALAWMLGRDLLTGMGWAGALGVIALCALVFMFYVRLFRGHGRTTHVLLPLFPRAGRARARLPRGEPATPLRASLPPGRGAPSLPPRPAPLGSGRWVTAASVHDPALAAQGVTSCSSASCCTER